MKLQVWLSKIKLLDNNFMNNKDDLINFIQLVNVKCLTIKEIIMEDKVKNKLMNKQCIICWDSEFQSFINNKKVDFVKEEKLTKCISELGILLLFNINNHIYLTGMFHLGFLNKKIVNSKYYIPKYHIYVSTLSDTTDKIIEIEKTVYPHLKYESEWIKLLNNCKSEHDIDIFKKNIKSIYNTDNLKKKYKEKFKNFNKILDNIVKCSDIQSNNNDVVKAIEKVGKNTIHDILIKDYKKNDQFKQIKELYMNDSYIKSININPKKHLKVLSLFYNMVFNNNSYINIVKEKNDYDALQNHVAILSDLNMVKFIGIKRDDLDNDNMKELYNKNIDIGNYNEDLKNNKQFNCESAKLKESYDCLFDKFKDNNNFNKIITESLLDCFKTDYIKPHNPLTDAYYTLNVFIKYNMLI